MPDIKLTCNETPLDWPSDVSLDDLSPCKTCELRIHSPQPGSLQIATRRDISGCSSLYKSAVPPLSNTAGAGDGVNIMENNMVGADYRGQRYTLDEVIFHAPGIHYFPNMNRSPYPAELHIHMYTNSRPVRYITIVVPASHLVDGPGQQYFELMSAQPDPTAVRPTLNSIFAPGAAILQYQGPDVRGRTADVPTPDSCASLDEREFLLVLTPAHIRATDLERIPREGSCATDARFMPAATVPHESRTTVPREKLTRIATLAVPGIRGSATVGGAPVLPEKELQCKPVRVVDGRDVVDVSGVNIDIYQLLGLGQDPADSATVDAGDTMKFWGKWITLFIGIIMGLLIMDFLFGFLWSWYLTGSRVATWEPIKIWLFFTVAVSTASGLAAVV